MLSAIIACAGSVMLRLSGFGRGGIRLITKVQMVGCIGLGGRGGVFAEGEGGEAVVAP